MGSGPEGVGSAEAVANPGGEGDPLEEKVARSSGLEQELGVRVGEEEGEWEKLSEVVFVGGAGVGV